MDRSRGRRPPTPRLGEYEARRDFAVTPEPAPGRAAPSAGAPIFMVHKHHATRLHYDLRLEMDGVLASWAIPKGPSYDPGVRRLAVQTEDHPLEYGGFEGRIPDGEYGAGDSLIWDRGTYDTVPPGEASRQRAKGHLHLALEGEKLRGRWHLVRTGRSADRQAGGKAQWLFFKAKDETVDPAYDVVAERPESVLSGRVAARGPERQAVLRVPRPAPERLLERVFPPMLATLVGRLPRDEGDWLFELKYDGFRALAGLSAGRVALWSRNRLDLASRFPALARTLGPVVVGDAVVDGEIVAFDPRGAPRFQLLQQGTEPVLVAFDLLWLDGEDLRGRPLEERRDLLESLLAHMSPAVRLAERIPGPGKAALAAAAARGYEGLIAKRRGSRYEGSRSRAWLKLKAVNAQEVAIVGFTRSKSQRDEIGALLVGVAEAGGLRYAGKVGTGFSSRQRAEFCRQLADDAAAAPRVAGAPGMRDATWVEPRLVAQVRFTEWTSDGKLRHPAFVGLRPDKSPGECVRETPAEPPPAAARARRPADPPAPARSVEVALTHPDRLLYPRDGITKQDVAGYYARVAGPLLRVVADRPLALEHWNDGIDAPPWFQQNIGKEAPPWMRLAETPTRASRRRVRHLIADRPEALRWLAQHSVLTIHMWSSRVQDLESPDWVVFDLDPAEGRGIEQAVEAALVLRGLFDRLSLPSVPKTSGQEGLHVFIPLAPGHRHEQAVEFAAYVCAAVARELPGVTVERSPGKRRGRLYLDAYQNGYGKTVAAPYSPRARDGAPVSAPLRWSEVTPRLDPLRYTIRTMPGRLDKVGDLFDPALRNGVRLPSLR
ncbi:MAG: DNA ligase D [Candidatus Rokubacteria bacterium]|nr:DNA ligase D [Candidatus Rokubacteria bacterium]